MNAQYLTTERSLTLMEYRNQNLVQALGNERAASARGRTILDDHLIFNRDPGWLITNLPLPMNPEKVSEALYECETAIEEYTERFTSHLEARDSRNRTWETTLVPSPAGCYKCHSFEIFPQEKKLTTLIHSAERARVSVLSANG